jgi:hypothetical protein
MHRWRLAAAAITLLVAATPAFADQTSALDAARRQPRAVDVKIDNQANLYVFVKPEKLAWGQYAAGMCGVVKPHQGRIFRVRVIDITQVNHAQPPGAWQRLAEADCAR